VAQENGLGHRTERAVDGRAQHSVARVLHGNGVTDVEQSRHSRLIDLLRVVLLGVHLYVALQRLGIVHYAQETFALLPEGDGAQMPCGGLGVGVHQVEQPMAQIGVLRKDL